MSGLNWWGIGFVALLIVLLLGGLAYTSFMEKRHADLDLIHEWERFRHDLALAVQKHLPRQP